LSPRHRGCYRRESTRPNRSGANIFTPSVDDLQDLGERYSISIPRQTFTLAWAILSTWHLEQRFEETSPCRAFCQCVCSKNAGLLMWRVAAATVDLPRCSPSDSGVDLDKNPSSPGRHQRSVFDCKRRLSGTPVAPERTCAVSPAPQRLWSVPAQRFQRPGGSGAHLRSVFQCCCVGVVDRCNVFKIGGLDLSTGAVFPRVAFSDLSTGAMFSEGAFSDLSTGAVFSCVQPSQFSQW
jgi:hypothetical protein